MARIGAGDIPGNGPGQDITSNSTCTHVQGAYGAPTGAVGGAADGHRNEFASRTAADLATLSSIQRALCTRRTSLSAQIAWNQWCDHARPRRSPHNSAENRFFLKRSFLSLPEMEAAIASIHMQCVGRELCSSHKKKSSKEEP